MPERVLLSANEPFYVEVGLALEAAGFEVPLVWFPFLELEPHHWRAMRSDPVRLGFREVLQADASRLAPAIRARSRRHDFARVRRILDAAPHVFLMYDQWALSTSRDLEQLDLFVRCVAFWDAILEETEVSTVVFHDAPHRGSDLVLYHLARLEGLETRIVYGTLIEDRLALRDDLEGVVGPSADEVRRALDADAATELPPSKLLDEIGPRFHSLEQLEATLSYRSLLAQFDVKNLLRRGPAAPVEQSWYYNQVAGRRWSEIEYRGRRAAALWQTRRLSRDYLRRTEDFDTAVLDAPFIYYPLHQQPERTTYADGGVAQTQRSVLALLSAGLPSGWSILVKEHPAQYQRFLQCAAGRSRRDYDAIEALPGVHLAPLTLDSNDLIRRSRAVATVTGSAGWEAVNQGKPAIVFGYPWYLHAPGVSRVTDFDDVADVMAQLEAGAWEVPTASVAAYSRVMRDRYTFPGAMNTEIADASGLDTAEVGRSISEALVASLGSGVAGSATRSSRAG